MIGRGRSGTSSEAAKSTRHNRPAERTRHKRKTSIQFNPPSKQLYYCNKHKDTELTSGLLNSLLNGKTEKKFQW